MPSLRETAAWVALLSSIICVASCAQGPSPSPLAVQPAADALTPVLVDEQETIGEAPLVGADTLIETSTVLPWQFVRLEGDEERVVMRYQVSLFCHVPRGVYVQESTTGVVLAPLASSDGSTTCAAIDFAPTLERVALTNPLGGRSLFHGQVDEKLQAVFDARVRAE